MPDSLTIRALDIGEKVAWLRKVGASYHKKEANKWQNLEARQSEKM